jgi:hypothetical protein
VPFPAASITAANECTGSPFVFAIVFPVVLFQNNVVNQPGLAEIGGKKK